MHDHPSTVFVSIHRPALDAIFSECDRFDSDETGGRLIGTYKKGRKGRLSLTVAGVIEPGTGAKRTATSFFHDGSYQERIFRKLEAEHPEIEHLGNWHTHHVNGYPTLSSGDRETYHRIVNHEKHNTDFFYALLITAKTARMAGDDRYCVKHYILFRDDRDEYEIPSSQITIVDKPAVWPTEGLRGPTPAAVTRGSTAAHGRAADSQFFKNVFPGLRAFLSKEGGHVYWRGRVVLCDGSALEIFVVELDEGTGPVHRISVKDVPRALSETANALAERQFSSASEAVVLLEREMNRKVFRTKITKAPRRSHALRGR